MPDNLAQQPSEVVPYIVLEPLGTKKKTRVDQAHPFFLYLRSFSTGADDYGIAKRIMTATEY